MVIKKFIGKTEQEAVEAAKKELGENIVIMSVRQMKPKGPFAFFKPRQTEVTAALEEERESVRKEPEREAVQQVAKVVAEADKNVRLAGQSGIEKKLDSLQTLLESRLKEEDKSEPGAEAKEKSGESGAGSAEPEDESPKDSEQEKFVRLLYNTMIDNEVAEQYANQILEDLDKSRKPNMPLDYVLANIYQKIILKFGKGEGILPAAQGPRVVFFIGPTGVGKTTTIAKLAGNFTVEKKKKVALLTADTYRIAAAEQLKTYACILEVPFRVIYSAEEMKEAVEAFRDYDYIFVDTAGHSHQNKEQMEKMREYLSAMDQGVESQVFLVLSATTKYKDLLRITDNYRGISDYQLIFTKLDETTTLGNLLNLRLYVDTSIAYTTSGQNVPSDIEQFNPQKTVKQILGGKA